MKYFYILLGFLFLTVNTSLIAYKEGKAKGANQVQIEFNNYKLVQQERLIALTKHNINLSDRLALQSIIFKEEKENAVQVAISKSNAIIASLQQRPERNSTSIVCTASSDTKTGTTELEGKGGTGEGLYREDAEFLIGEATSAEILKQLVKDCRARYDLIQSVPNEKDV
jgi:hypothetical protein